MKKFSQQLHNEAKTVKLQVAEKRELRERLISYMEYHPLPAEMKVSSVKQVAKAQPFTEAFTNVSIPFSRLFKYSAALATLVLIIVPFVAERAVPGDTLYAMKVQFNEEVVSSLKFDTYQKVEWETERLNRRISEARLLASEGRLTEAVEAEVAEAVKTHTENAKREIEELRTQDADEATIASIELDTTLEVQSAALRSDSTTLEVDNESVSSPANLIANVIDASRSQTEDDNASTTPPAYEKLMARVEQNTTRIYELLNSLQGAADAEQLNDVTRRIEDIERAVKVAIETYATDEAKARELMIGILQRTQKLIVYMTEIEVKQTIDIETLVPVVLTDSEHVLISNNLQSELDQKLAIIKELELQVQDENILAKVAFVKVQIDELIVNTSTTSADFVTFEANAKEALTMINDVIATLEQHLNIKAEDFKPEEIETDEATSTEAVVDETDEATTSEAVEGI